jgi:3-oxoacyl-[acyl-carrier-protein] synthase-3
MTKKILRLLVDAIDRIVMRCGVGMSGIDVVVPHQMNGRIVSAMARRAGLPEEKVFVNLRRMGNTAAASIPIALCDAIHEGRIRSHDLVLLAAAGAGLTWGTALVRWS